MSVGVSLGRFTFRAMPRRSRWSATVRRWTPNSRPRSSNERPCWYSAATAATSDDVSRRWTGFVGRRAAPPGVGESTPSTSARSALEPGFECCPLLFRPPSPGRFGDRLAAFGGFRPAAGSRRNPYSGDVSRVSGGFESRPQRSTLKVLVIGYLWSVSVLHLGGHDTSMTQRVQPMTVTVPDSAEVAAMASRASFTLLSEPGYRCPYRSRTVTTEVCPALAAISRGLAPAAIQSATAVCRRS